jgi:hypothetical protein
VNGCAQISQQIAVDFKKSREVSWLSFGEWNGTTDRRLFYIEERIANAVHIQDTSKGCSRSLLRHELSGQKLFPAYSLQVPH